MDKPSFAIVGCGRLGTSLGKHLSDTGYPLIGLTSKSLESVKQTARIINTDKFGDMSPWEVTKSADVVFITTPDDVITDACKNLAENGGFKTGAIVLHCSGAHPSTILSSAKASGALIGSMHPLQSFASKEISGNPFQGIIVSVEGDDVAVEVAKKMATDLDAVCITIRTDSKTFYHASAVVASNYLVALLHLAVKLMVTAGISEEESFNVLRPLINGTLSNIEKAGLTKALTGPIARGDDETVRGHITAIVSRTPELISLYKSLGIYTVDIAQEKGDLSEDTINKLRKLLRA